MGWNSVVDDLEIFDKKYKSHTETEKNKIKGILRNFDEPT